MRICLECHPHKSFTNKGWYTHMARKHKMVRPRDVYDALIRPEQVKGSIRAAFGTVPCPHPFCREVISEIDVLTHLEKEHPDWKKADGRFVFDVEGSVRP